MKKTFSLILAILLLLSGCSSEYVYTQADMDALIASHEDKLSSLKDELEEKLLIAEEESEKQYEAGKTVGYDLGFNAGYKDGISESEDSYARGYEAGLSASDDAYNQGYEDGKASVKNSSSSASSSSNSNSSGNSSTTSYTVYVTKTGEKYHRGSCSYLRQSKIAIDKSKAISQGYTACSRCKP